jgi:hypothetical protein
MVVTRTAPAQGAGHDPETIPKRWRHGAETPAGYRAGRVYHAQPARPSQERQMPRPPAPPRYQAWLLRCWEERGVAAPTWRFNLEDPHTGARQGFTGLAALVAHLEAALAADRPAREAGGDDAGSQFSRAP